VRFIVIDPGDTTGYAIFDDDKPVEFGYYSWVLDTEERGEHYPFCEWLRDDLDTSQLDRWVIEQYRVRPRPVAKGYGHQFSEVQACRVIGACTQVATYHQQPVHFVETSQLDPGYAQTGIPKDHRRSPFRHSTDAVVHGMLFWRGRAKYGLS
jgi:hypothetical protein